MPYTYTLNALPEPWEEGRTDARADDGRRDDGTDVEEGEER